MGQIPAFHSAVQVQSDKSACTITCQRDTADTISADEREHVNYIHAYARNVNSAHTPHVYGPPPPTHTHTHTHWHTHTRRVLVFRRRTLHPVPVADLITASSSVGAWHFDLHAMPTRPHCAARQRFLREDVPCRLV